jgi:hypothetical protein
VASYYLTQKRTKINKIFKGKGKKQVPGELFYLDRWGQVNIYPDQVNGHLRDK